MQKQSVAIPGQPVRGVAMRSGPLRVLRGQHYFTDRGRDFVDVFDAKAGFQFGFGAKVEATRYVGYGVGAGFGGIVWQAWDKHGRRICRPGIIFLHAAVLGEDSVDFNEDNGYVLGLNLEQIKRPFVVRSIRFGGEVLIPGIDLGLYLNLGELADFFCGIFGVDIARDDEPKEGEAEE